MNSYRECIPSLKSSGSNHDSITVEHTGRVASIAHSFNGTMNSHMAHEFQTLSQTTKEKTRSIDCASGKWDRGKWMGGEIGERNG